MGNCYSWLCCEEQARIPTTYARHCYICKKLIFTETENMIVVCNDGCANEAFSMYSDRSNFSMNNSSRFSLE